MWFGTLAVTARGSFNRHWKITFQNELFDLDNRFVIDLTRTIDRDTDFILTVIHCYPLEIVRGVIASKFHRHGTFGFTTRDTVDKIITGTSRWLVTENICTHGTCSRRLQTGSREPGISYGNSVGREDHRWKRCRCRTGRTSARNWITFRQNRHNKRKIMVGGKAVHRAYLVAHSLACPPANYRRTIAIARSSLST